ILLAWATKVWVEDRFRNTGWIASTRRHAYQFAVVGMVVVVAAGIGLDRGLQERAEQAGPSDAIGGDPVLEGCVGPAALDPAQGCASVTGTGSYIPSLEAAVLQNSDPIWADCQASLASEQMVSCVLGSDSPDPVRTIAMIGDSHGTQWFSAMDALGKRLDWQVITYTKSSCPPTVALRTLPDEDTSERVELCQQWREQVTADLAQREDISAVVVAAYSSAYGYQNWDGQELADPAVDGYAQQWQQWLAPGRDVHVIAAIPRTTGENVPDCLAVNSVEACTTQRSVSLPADPLIAASQTDERFHLIDLTPRFCDAQLCYPVVGDMIVYRDYSHLTAEYARALVPLLESALTATG
ncbi:MAG: SGNH hydrolase domain-containing protein, partial [Beutenbergiaceae bacterium]